ncbi:hypothetical protein K435DRAFT_966163 [Dendrothele bispora CBS 962.96]|uniref:Uncharacterized protein n=1 Tax=Dendrothele bispora (strain CBS 962.96) TaxID=1314807 RepID=A0A4S8M247_DENBC|nr:hypothetical protein K435DRAFT_966163 [Dendrothele bispora CBS 962.96]
MTSTKIGLSLADQKIAKELGQKLFNYETSTENHAAILRADPTGYSKAYREYVKTFSPAPMGTLPPPNEMDRCILESERLLTKECTTPLDHCIAVNAGMLLLHAFTWKITQEYSNEIFMAALAYEQELTSQHPIPPPQPAVFPPDILELMAIDPNRMSTSGYVGIGSEPQTHSTPILDSSPWPISMPTTSLLTWNDILEYPSFPISSETLANYKLSPQSTLKQIFVSFDEASTGKPVEAFRVISVTFHEQDIIFYLLFVDEDEALGFGSKDFYDMIKGMKQVRVE